MFIIVNVKSQVNPARISRLIAWAGHRPALVLSPAQYNGASGLMLCCPMTTQVKGYPFEVPVDAPGGQSGVVLADQVKSVDWKARRAQRKDRASDAVVADVLARIQALLR